MLPSARHCHDLLALQLAAGHLRRDGGVVVGLMRQLKVVKYKYDLTFLIGKLDTRMIYVSQKSVVKKKVWCPLKSIQVAK